MPLSDSQKTLSKVPEITALFWVVKVLTTGMGETTSDYLTHVLNPAVAVVLGAMGLIVFLLMQFSTPRYNAWIYWVTVVMVSVFGTMAADVLHVGLGIPYIDSSSFYAIILVVIFLTWHHFEKTLSIHSITTRRREFFYWATVLATFALGTAVGDLTAGTFGWGYLTSGIIFAIIMLIPSILRRGFKVSEVFTFWFAYIITRPLGASFADWMGVSHARGGLNWGTGPVSLVLFILIVIAVSYLSAKENKHS